MNFYSNKLSTKRYLNILNRYQKKFSKEFIIKNFGAFIGDQSFYRTLVCFKLLNETRKIKGDIVEFGVWNGNNLFTLKKIIDFLKINKKIIGYDHFKGMPMPSKNNYFRGDKKFISYIIKYYNFKNIKIIEDDMLNLKKYLSSFSKLSFIYIDCGLYDTTVNILKLLHKKLSIGGIIAFDEGYRDFKTGETKAMYEFYLKNRNKYKKIVLKKYYQPDVYLKRIK